MKREHVTRQVIGKQEIMVVRREIHSRGVQAIAKPAGRTSRSKQIGSGIIGEVAAALAYSGRFPATWWRA